MSNPLAIDWKKKLESDYNSFLPDVNNFLIYIEPYLKLIKEDYNHFLQILSKLGINGLQEYTSIYLNIGKTDFKLENDSFKKLFEEIPTINIDTKLSPDDLAKKIVKDFSFEKTLPYGVDLIDDMELKFDAAFEKENKKFNKLPKAEQDLFHYFNLLTTKLWIRNIITSDKNPFISQFIIPPILHNFYNSLNAFYEKQIIPQSLIDYLEKIEIPSLQETTKIQSFSLNPKKTLPVFCQKDDIYKVLYKYFEKEQQETFKYALEKGSSSEKLVFKGQGNQLADAFKKLYEFNLIIACNKEGLILWIISVFEYQNLKKENTRFNKSYLEEIISGTQKDCKNPILDIKVNSETMIIYSPARKGRKV
jgi:hypothetical protein